MECPLSECLKRNSLRPTDDQISAETIEKMASIFEIPDSDSNSWEQRTLCINTRDDFNFER